MLFRSHSRQFQRGRARLLRFMISRSWRNGAHRVAGDLLLELVRSNPRGALQQAGALAFEKLAPWRRKRPDARIGQAYLASA